jgi:hypothetical protein
LSRFHEKPPWCCGKVKHTAKLEEAIRTTVEMIRAEADGVLKEHEAAWAKEKEAALAAAAEQAASALASAVDATRQQVLAENAAAIAAERELADKRVAEKLGEIQHYKDLYLKEANTRRQLHNELVDLK